jgi:hypothetical protein
VARVERAVLGRLALPVDDISRRQNQTSPHARAETGLLLIRLLLHHSRIPTSLPHFIGRVFASRLYSAAVLTLICAMNR